MLDCDSDSASECSESSLAPDQHALNSTTPGAAWRIMQASHSADTCNGEDANLSILRAAIPLRGRGP